MIITFSSRWNRYTLVSQKMEKRGRYFKIYETHIIHTSLDRKWMERAQWRLWTQKRPVSQARGSGEKRLDFMLKITPHKQMTLTWRFWFPTHRWRERQRKQSDCFTSSSFPRIGKSIMEHTNERWTANF